VAPILEPEDVAEGIVEATLTNQIEVILPTYMMASHKIFNLLPTQALKRVQRFIGYGVGPHDSFISCKPDVPSIITSPADDDLCFKKGD